MDINEVLDYGRSFISGKAASNSVRFWVESRTTVIDERGAEQTFYQCGSCKSERTFAERDLFSEGNYDFLPIFGPTDGVVFRRPKALSERYRDTRPAGQWWDGQVYRLAVAAPSVELTDNDAIRRATHAAQPLVARTELRDEASGRRAIIEYPIKTMNIHDQRNIYQVDTGPVAWPDLQAPADRAVDRLHLAFVAFNVANVADFVIEWPTTLDTGDGEAAAPPQVHHFSRIVSLAATNRLYAVGELPA